MAKGRSRHARRAVAGLTTFALGFALTATTVGAASSAPGHAANSAAVNEDAHLRFKRSSGPELYEEGRTTGSLSGMMHAWLHASSTFSGSFVLYTRLGQIRGHGIATPHGSGRYQSFSGTTYITGGTGRYVHARGTGGLYGVFDRRTFAVLLQTRGRFSY